MSVELSRRLAKVSHQPPLAFIAGPERRRIWLACERAAHFSDLSEPDQQLILAAEAARERAIAEQRRVAAS
jgi:hypothetical protein